MESTPLPGSKLRVGVVVVVVMVVGRLRALAFRGPLLQSNPFGPHGKARESPRRRADITDADTIKVVAAAQRSEPREQCRPEPSLSPLRYGGPPCPARPLALPRQSEAPVIGGAPIEGPRAEGVTLAPLALARPALCHDGGKAPALPDGGASPCRDVTPGRAKASERAPPRARPGDAGREADITQSGGAESVCPPRRGRSEPGLVKGSASGLPARPHCLLTLLPPPPPPPPPPPCFDSTGPIPEALGGIVVSPRRSECASGAQRYAVAPARDDIAAAVCMLSGPGISGPDTIRTSCPQSDPPFSPGIPAGASFDEVKKRGLLGA
ncbi:unnamed protein product [Gadus morhua 'NCC']